MRTLGLIVGVGLILTGGWLVAQVVAWLLLKMVFGALEDLFQ